MVVDRDFPGGAIGYRSYQPLLFSCISYLFLVIEYCGGFWGYRINLSGSIAAIGGKNPHVICCNRIICQAVIDCDQWFCFMGYRASFFANREHSHEWI